jgi:hypothetical protein
VGEAFRFEVREHLTKAAGDPHDERRQDRLTKVTRKPQEVSPQGLIRAAESRGRTQWMCRKRAGAGKGLGMTPKPSVQCGETRKQQVQGLCRPVIEDGNITSRATLAVDLVGHGIPPREGPLPASIPHRAQHAGCRRSVIRPPDMVDRIPGLSHPQGFSAGDIDADAPVHCGDTPESSGSAPRDAEGLRGC